MFAMSHLFLTSLFYTIVSLAFGAARFLLYIFLINLLYDSKGITRIPFAPFQPHQYLKRASV